MFYLSLLAVFISPTPPSQIAIFQDDVTAVVEPQEERGPRRKVRLRQLGVDRSLFPR